MVIKVNSHQRGNNVLDFLTQVRWSFYDTLTTDYEIENFISVLFLSLRFHTQKPDYIFSRLNQLREYKVQILLILIDLQNYEEYLKEFVVLDHQIFYCFSNDEAAKYLAALDLNAHRSTDILKQKYSHDLDERKQEFIIKFPKLNKNDAKKLTRAKSIFSLLANENYKKQKITDKKIKSIEYYLNMSFQQNEESHESK